VPVPVPVPVPVHTSTVPPSNVLARVLTVLGNLYTMTFSHLRLPLNDSVYKLSGLAPALRGRGLCHQVLATV
jgi:hypothetical protein